MTDTDDKNYMTASLKGRKATGCAVAVLAWAVLAAVAVCAGGAIALWEALGPQ